MRRNSDSFPKWSEHSRDSPAAQARMNRAIGWLMTSMVCRPGGRVLPQYERDKRPYTGFVGHIRYIPEVPHEEPTGSGLSGTCTRLLERSVASYRWPCSAAGEPGINGRAGGSKASRPDSCPTGQRRRRCLGRKSAGSSERTCRRRLRHSPRQPIRAVYGVKGPRRGGTVLSPRHVRAQGDAVSRGATGTRFPFQRILRIHDR